MIRLYKPAIEQITCALMGLKMSLRSLVGMSNEESGRTRINDAYSRLTGARYQEIISGVEEWSTIDQFLTQLRIQLKQSEAGVDVDLIDQVVQICKFPYIGSSLSPNVIRNLQKAILLPEEIGELKASVRSKEMVCYSCSHTFQPGEMVTFDVDTTTGSVRFSCSLCQTPTSLNCSCGKTRNMPDPLYRKIIKEMKTCSHATATGGDALPTSAGMTGTAAANPLDPTTWETPAPSISPRIQRAWQPAPRVATLDGGRAGGRPRPTGIFTGATVRPPTRNIRNIYEDAIRDAGGILAPADPQQAQPANPDPFWEPPTGEGGGNGSR